MKDLHGGNASAVRCAPKSRFPGHVDRLAPRMMAEMNSSGDVAVLFVNSAPVAFPLVIAGLFDAAPCTDNRPKFQLIPKIRLLPGETPKGVVPSNLDRGEETCLESAVDLLIPRPW